MNRESQSGTHLDADLLSAFAEGALNDVERLHCMEHLSACEHCRGVLFLAQPEAVVEEALPQPEKPWHRWFPSFAAAGLAFGCALIVMLVVRSRHVAAPAPTQIAAVAPSDRVNALPPQPIEAPSTPAPRAVASHDLSSPKPVPSQPGGTLAGGVVQPSVIEELPLNGRNFAALTPLQARKEAARDLQGTLGEERKTLRGEWSAAAPVQSQASDQLSKSDLAMAAPPDPNTSPMARGAREKSNVAVSPPPVAVLEGHAAIQGYAAGTGSAVAMPAVGVTIEAGRGPVDGLAALTGVVSDPTGAVIAGARVRARQVDGSGAGHAVTNAQGGFSLASLPVGSYELTIESPGFLPEVRRLQLGSRDLAVVQSKLAPGASSETVMVSSEATELNTMDARSVSELPMTQQKWVSQVTSRGRTLAVDASGKLFVSKNGKRWKAVKGKWVGKVARLEVASADKAAEVDKDAAKAATGTGSFVITTDSGEAWTSVDGTHWTRR